MAKAKTKKTEFTDMTADDLKNRLNSISEELILARRKLRMGQFKKTSEFPRLRKEVARIKTHLRSRELAEKKARA